MVLRLAMAVVALVAAVAATDCTAGEYDSFRNYLSSCKMGMHVILIMMQTRTYTHTHTHTHTHTRTHTGDMTCMQGKFNSLDALDATGTCRTCITSAFSGGDFAGVSNCFPTTAASAPSQQQGNPCSDKDLKSVYPIISAECQYDFVCAKDVSVMRAPRSRLLLPVVLCMVPACVHTFDSLLYSTLFAPF
jgi:hypothetical protein